MNKINARSVERAFIRKINKGKIVFKTATGKENSITEVTDHSLIFSTRKATSRNKLHRKRLRMAIQYVIHVRTATRKDMELFIYTKKR